jgi:uncharacterized protein (DUF885 family)
MSLGMPTYTDLINSYYRAWFRFHPEVAVEFGVDGYAHLLAPYDDDDVGAEITLHEKLLDAIDEIDTGQLTEDQIIDLKIMQGQAILESHRLIETDWRLKEPGRFLPVNAIYQLTIRPVKNRGAALQKRLQAIPNYLRGAKSHLQTLPESIPAIWLQSAIAEAHEGVSYFRGLHHHPLLQPLKLDSELDTAAHALEEFACFLEQDIGKLATGSFAVGKTTFQRLLLHRHGLDISADELHAFGASLYAQVLSELKEVTRELQGNDDIASLTEKIQHRYKPDRDLLTLYKENMLTAHDFVKQHDLVTMPDQQFLHVVETPAFLRHQIPFAAYLDPMPTDSAQTGYYYVTPPQDEQSWGEHNLLSLQHTCVHEAWPGHHLQFVTANRDETSRSLPRLVNASATMYEGWALYCEQLMYEQGFLQQPESKFVLLKDRLWRSLRVMLDVELHVRDRSIEQASQVMQDKLGFSAAQALGDLSWYSQSPTVPMGYATGWLLINMTRDRLQAMNDSFSLKDFHDRLLSAGSIGLPWVISRAFGQPLWRTIRENAFRPAEATTQPVTI